MKIKLFALSICSLSLSLNAAVSLEDSFKSSLKNMESIKRAKSQVYQTEEQKKQALAEVLPTISGVGSYTQIDAPKGAGASPFLLTRQHSAALRLNQPLFRGGLVSAYELAKENILLAKFQEEATHINLYQLVISAYYNLVAAKADVLNVEELLKYSKDRVKEIKERVVIGRSRRGELVEAEAQLKIAESQLHQVIISKNRAQQNYEFYTGLSTDDLILPKSVPDLKGPVDKYIQSARKRPDLLAKQQEVHVAEKQIQIAKGGHYPQLDLTSNYYFDRTGVLSTSDWDVGLAVVIPLYQGGGVEAGVKRAVEGKRIAELSHSETKRAADRDVMINYQNIVELKLQLQFLREALKKSEEVYRLNKKDYQLGLVTNLDVLQSLNVFIETKRSFDGLIAVGNLNYKNLEALAGELP